MSKNTYYKYQKYRIYPTEEQKQYINYCLNVSRYIYNWALNLQNKQYEKYLRHETDQQIIHDHELRKMYEQHVKENPWLKDFQVDPARYIIHRLDNAFTMFFKGENNHPQFKSKKRERYKNKHAYRIRHDRFYIDGRYIRIPGFKRNEMIDLKFNTGIYQKDNVKYHQVDIIVDNLGNYSVGFYIEEDKPEQYFIENNIPKLGSAIGIDINARSNRRYVCSDGFIFEGSDISSKIKHIDKLNSEINKGLNKVKEMAKTKPNAKISKKLRKKIIQRRKIYHKIHNITENDVQNFTKNVINKNPSCVVMESLNVRYSMNKNKNVSRYIHFLPFWRCKEVMMYKCNQYDIPFISASRTYPSSQLCSNCGNRRKISPGTKVYNCPNCGISIDRDINAAINLEKLAYIEA